MCLYRGQFKAIGPRVSTAAETTSDARQLNKKAHQIMTRKPVVIDTSADVKLTIRIFLEKGVSCLPTGCVVLSTQSALSVSEILYGR